MSLAFTGGMVGWGSIASPSSPAGLHWQELGRTTLSGTSDTIEVTSLEAKPYMMILSHNIVTSDHNMTWSTGTGSYSGSYADRRSENGGSDLTTTNRTTNGIISDAHTKNMFTVGNLLNTDGQEKLVNWSVVGNNADGAGNAPDRFETVGKFTGTSQINQIKLNNSSSINNEIGSEVVVLGYDPADTEGGSVWEELASVDTSTAHDVIDTGTFTNKKYLWLQCFVKGDGNANGSIIFNTDTSNTGYAMRRSYDGANESTYAGTNPAGSEGSYDGYGATGAGKYYNMFIVNNGSNEALWISQINVGNPTGANNAPHRVEWVGKWDLTDAITRIRIKNQDAGTDYDESSIKVWGFD